MCKDPSLTESEIAIMLLKAILEQEDPMLRSVLIEKLGTGPSSVLVADCIARLSQLGLSVQAPHPDQSPNLEDAQKAFVHKAHRTVQ